MIKIFNTNEVASKTGLSDRAVRRRITETKPTSPNAITGVAITPLQGGRTTYGVTEQSLNTFLKKNR